MSTRNNRNNRNQAAPPRTLEVITTHLNADFDAMASMVAAKKLYPEALLVFPGSQERNLRDFFIRSSFYFVDFTRMKQVPLEEIKRLILVDTRQASRIGKFAEVAASGEVDIHIYDHHPDTDEDVHGSRGGRGGDRLHHRHPHPHHQGAGHHPVPPGGHRHGPGDF